MLIIDKYTGIWQRALAPRMKAPRLGSYVKIANLGDAREYFDFKFILNMAGKDLKFVRWMPRKKFNEYKVVKSN